MRELAALLDTLAAIAQAPAALEPRLLVMVDA